MADPKIWPPVADEELKNCHSYENLQRVVVTQNHIFALAVDGHWLELRPLKDDR